MKSFQHLVVAIDGSEGSKSALELGIEISKQLHSELSVIHIQKEELLSDGAIENSPLNPTKSLSVNELRNYPIIPEPTTNDHLSNNHINKKSAWETEAKRILAKHHVNGRVETTYGDPAEVIVSYAKEKEADLIVIGRRDISGLKRLIFGSVSETISDRSNIPVLIAK